MNGPAGFPSGDGIVATQDLAVRLRGIAREAPGFDAEALVRELEAAERTPESKRDLLTTRLMECFRDHRDRNAFGLLYEISGPHLYRQVASRLRRYASKADPHDVLQEVFFNIYRYPHRFDGRREDAYRVWTATIVRNTVLKHLRSLSRSGRAEVPFDDVPEPSGGAQSEPLQGAIDRESRTECSRVYLLYLHLYLRFYGMLSTREQEAIRLVEVDGASYREAAERLGIKLENLKMVIFRARRKIHRSMQRVFRGLPPDLRPARDPSPPRPGSASPPETTPASIDSTGSIP